MICKSHFENIFKAVKRKGMAHLVSAKSVTQLNINDPLQTSFMLIISRAQRCGLVKEFDFKCPLCEVSKAAAQGKVILCNDGSTMPGDPHEWIEGVTDMLALKFIGKL